MLNDSLSFRGFLRLTLLLALIAVSPVLCVDSRVASAVETGTGRADATEFPDTLFRWSSSAAPEGGSPGWDEPLASDRPDFTEASSTVGRGVSQLEIGYTYFFDESGTAELASHSYPEILFRQGILADWLELRVGWSFNSETAVVSGITGTSHGSDDIYLGIKLGLTPQQGWLPEMSLTPQMTVPVGGQFTADRTLPGLNWLYGWDVTERLATGGSTQYNLSVDEFTGKLHGLFAQSWTVGYSLADRLSGYTEWFVLAPAGAETEHTEHYFDGGLAYRWSNNLQSDVRVGKGVSSASTDYFAGTGVVVRF